MTSTHAESVSESVRAYARLYRKYEGRHPEIFNEIEQDRLHKALSRALGMVETGARPCTALDIGCGSGNVTRHLLELGADVVAADVSPRFLDLVEERFDGAGRVNTLLLNGIDLSGVEDESVDLVTVYSVLHHIPDYCGVVRELGRVLRPGGVAFIDHERSEEFWRGSEQLDRYQAALTAARRRRLSWKLAFRRSSYAKAAAYARYRVRTAIDPHYQSEGDIHVFPDDHILWSHVEEDLIAGGIAPLVREDYLLYSSRYDEDIWRRFRDTCGDVTLLIGRRDA